MSKYCDTKKLEHNWYSWIVASKTPVLEPFRKLGILWSKPYEYIECGSRKYPNPKSKGWMHCIAIGSPFYFANDSGVLCHHSSHPVNSYGMVPNVEWLELDSHHECLVLDNPFIIQQILIPDLISNNYILEQPTNVSWDNMNEDILHICQGVARKFLLTDEDRADLIQETMVQVIRKLRTGRMVYEPGRAPVFNYVTTAVHRCCFSILAKSARYRKSTNKLLNDADTGIIPKSMRDFRLY